MRHLGRCHPRHLLLEAEAPRRDQALPQVFTEPRVPGVDAEGLSVELVDVRDAVTAAGLRDVEVAALGLQRGHSRLTVVAAPHLRDAVGALLTVVFVGAQLTQRHEARGDRALSALLALLALCDVGGLC